MFDIGMTELLVIGIVALIVVGPKDLPGMFRALGRFTGKMRGMAREFQRAMEDAADETGVKDVARDFKGMSNPKKFGLDTLKDATGDLTKWDPDTAAKGTPKGPATQALTEERRAQAEALRQTAAERAEARRTAEAAKTAEAEDDEGAAAPEPKA